MLNVHAVAVDNSIYGPGKRTVIWFRGCSIRCKNCINPELWKRDTKCDISINDLMCKIKNNEVTLLGGEPLDQEDLEQFIDALKENNIGIILFTGYSTKDYDERKKRITEKCDVVISEPFIQELKDDSLYLRGSLNQIIAVNSNRYENYNFSKSSSFEMDINNNHITSFGRDKNIINEILELN